jgi:hypothetical protein
MKLLLAKLLLAAVMASCVVPAYAYDVPSPFKFEKVTRSLVLLRFRHLHLSNDVGRAIVVDAGSTRRSQGCIDE